MCQRVRDEPSRARKEAVFTRQPGSLPHGRGSARGFSHTFLGLSHPNGAQGTSLGLIFTAFRGIVQTCVASVAHKQHRHGRNTAWSGDYVL